jgi:neutral ceramidase
LAAGAGQPPPGPFPPNNVNVSISLIADVVYDNPHLFTSFGEVLDQPASTYSIGDVVNATFVGANPRNNLRLEGTFTEVQQLVDGTWTTARDDHDWHLEYTWYRDDVLLGSSHVVISWETEDYTVPGTYRIVYNGDAKAPITGTISAFTGTSDSFTLS